MKSKALCHKMIKAVAKEQCAATWEAWATTNNEFYKKYPLRESYVASAWPLFINEARATLSEMLSRPLDQKLKDEIFDALIKDDSFRHGRNAAIGRMFQ